MNASEVFWTTFAQVAGWGLGLLAPFIVGSLFLIGLAMMMKRAKYYEEFRSRREKRSEARPDSKMN